MKENFDKVSFGDGETNFFGANSTKELNSILQSAGKYDLRSIASKVGLNCNYSSTILKDMIVKAFREYQARNAPVQAPKEMFKDAPESVLKMMKSVGKVGEEERAKRMESDQRKRTSLGVNKPELQTLAKPEKKKRPTKKVAKKSPKKRAVKKTLNKKNK